MARPDATSNATHTVPAELAQKDRRLRAIFRAMDSVLVAFSGGVDSAFTLRVAHDELGDRATALTTVSPTNPEDDTRTAIGLAQRLGVTHVLITANELDIPGYAANPLNRCYFCKDALYDICAMHARAHGIGTIVDGVNADDLADFRPGLRAADEHGTRHPLVEADLRKADIRMLSRSLGLETWDKPASPCLSSRFPYGTRITLERLQMVAAGEQVLHDEGFREVRVRYHGDVARLEIGRAELPRLAGTTMRQRITNGLRAAGFRHVTLDLAGFRSGSLNAGRGPHTPGA